MDIRVDPDFSALCPPLSEEERQLLEDSIIAEGCRDAVVVWDGVLLDGHNRFAICNAHGLPFETLEAEGVRSNAEARAWVIDNQLGRRNLTREQAAYLRGKRYLEERRDPGRPEKGGQSDHVSEGRTEARLSEQSGVSPRTVRRDASYAQAVDTLAQAAGAEARDAVLGRKNTLTRKDTLQLAAVVREQPAEDAAATVRSALQGDRAMLTPPEGPGASSLADVHGGGWQEPSSSPLAMAPPSPAPSPLAPAPAPAGLAELEARLAELEAENTALRKSKGSRRALTSSASVEWYTPPEYIDAARRVLGGIDLDPASCDEANAIVHARQCYTAADNGLALPWFGRLWLNAPYGWDEDGDSRQAVWSAHLLEAYRDRAIKASVSLWNVATGSAWFQALWDVPLCFPDHRIRYIGPGGVASKQPTHANVFAYLGDDVAAFAREFVQFGRIVVPSFDGISESYGRAR